MAATTCICSAHSTRMEPSVALEVRPLTSSSTMGKNWAIREDQRGAQGERHHLVQASGRAFLTRRDTAPSGNGCSAPFRVRTQRTLAVQHAAIMTANQVVSVHSVKFAGARSATIPCQYQPS